MLDLTRQLRITGSVQTDRNGPATLLIQDGEDIVVRSADGAVLTFGRDGRTRYVAARYVRLGNAPIRTTTTYYARKSAGRPGEIKLQTIKPQLPIGQIEVDVEGDKIVGVRLA